MDMTALMLSRIQFASTVSFHIIFPAFTVGLAAWLTVLEAMSIATDRPVYRRLSDFWRSVFAVAFGLGVVSGIVMAFQFGTNWSELSRRTGAIQGPLLHESFTAFAPEASFFGVMMFGRDRVPRWFYCFACLMVATGTTLVLLDHGQQQLDVLRSVTRPARMASSSRPTGPRSSQPGRRVRFPHTCCLRPT
jgi:cytochrome d ubiquinol oxidase subunit I